MNKDEYKEKNIEMMQKNEKEEKKQSHVVKIEEIEIKSLLEESLTKEEKSFLLGKIISNLQLEDIASQEYASSIYHYLLNREGTYEESEINFITFFTIYLNYRKIKYDEEGNVRQGYNKVRIPSIEVTPYVQESESALAAYSLSTVYISSELSINPFKDGDKDCLFAYIQALSHEMVHYRQDYEASHGLLTESSFKCILEQAIRWQEYDDNSLNYRFRETEVEAQIESMQYAVELAQEYFPSYLSFQEEMLFRRENYLMEEALSFQYDDEKILALRDFYDIGLLSIAVAKGIQRNNITIDLLKVYPQLLAFFDENKNIRSEEELLKGYQFAKETNNPISNIYEQFLVYIYHKEPNLQNESLSSELLQIKRSFIISQIEKEKKFLEQIEYMIHYREHAITRITRRWKLNVEEIIKQRKERIKYYKAFIESRSEFSETDEIQNIINIELNAYELLLDKIDKTVAIDNMLDKVIKNANYNNKK